jgi:hypothetical protein
MNARNSTSRRNNGTASTDVSEDSNTINNDNSTNSNSNSNNNNKTRKKREELSISATKSIKKETVEIVVSFN